MRKYFKIFLPIGSGTAVIVLLIIGLNRMNCEEPLLISSKKTKIIPAQIFMEPLISGLDDISDKDSANYAEVVADSLKVEDTMENYIRKIRMEMRETIYGGNNQ